MLWLVTAVAAAESYALSLHDALPISPTNGYADLDTRTLVNNSGGTVAYTPNSTGFQWRFGAVTSGRTSIRNNASHVETSYAASGVEKKDFTGPSTITNTATGTFAKTA